MRGVQVSIRATMAAVILVALSLAAARDVDGLWAGCLLLLALGLFGVAILGVVHRRGGERAWWLGFALFEGGYLLLALGPWFSESITPKLGTTRVIERLAHPGDPTASMDPATLRSRQVETLAALDRTSRAARNPRADPAVRFYESKLQQIQGQLAGGGARRHWPLIGHVDAALLAGLIGATVSRRMWAGRGEPGREGAPDDRPQG